MDKILNGTADDEIADRAKSAAFDERLSLLGLVFDAICAEVRKVSACENSLTALMNNVKALRVSPAFMTAPATALREKASALFDGCERAKRSGAMSAESIKSQTDAAKALEKMASAAEKEYPFP